MFSKKDININTIRHILIIRFLGVSIDDIFNKKYKYKPFGEGPWPCLNLLSRGYKNKVSHIVDRNKRDYKILKKVKVAVNDILNIENKPVRLTVCRIGTIIKKGIY